MTKRRLVVVEDGVTSNSYSGLVIKATINGKSHKIDVDTGKLELLEAENE